MKKGGGRSTPSSQTLQGLVKSVISKAGPMLLKGAMTYATGIPFPTSGARAIASPDPSSVMQLSAPASNGSMVRTSKARIINTKQGIRVCHREYIMDVVHEDANEFELLLFELVSPTNQRIFPWLSSIANRFETFRFESLDFIYEPQSSTTAVGTVMQAVDYDANDDPPTTKTQLMSYKNAVRSPAWFASVNKSDRADLQKQKNYYTIPSPTDNRLNGIGKYILALQSESTPYTAGELYVEYCIVLETPQLQNSSPTSHLIFGPTLIPAGTNANVKLAQPVSASGNLPVTATFDGSGNAFLNFEQAGTFLVALYTGLPQTFASGSGTFQWGSNIPAGSLLILSNEGYQGLVQQIGTSVGSLSIMALFLVRNPSPGELLQIYLSNTGTSGSPTVTPEAIIVPIEDIFDVILPQPTSSASLSSTRSLRLLSKRVQALRLEPPSFSSEPSQNSREFLLKTNRNVPNGPNLFAVERIPKMKFESFGSS